MRKMEIIFRKKKYKRMFTYIWNFANEEGFIPTPGDGSTPINPTKSIIIKRPEEFDNDHKI